MDMRILRIIGTLDPAHGGPGEVPAAMQAIADSPIIGQGSWAKNMEYGKRPIPLLPV